MPLQTALYQKHLASNANIVDFAGWQMPIAYGSQLQEHHQVRKDVGMFDVSHMTIIDLKGKDAKPYLRYLLANDVNKLTQSGKALYSCLLNHDAGIIDDLIVYYLDDNFYRIVVNAATRAKDLAWMQQQLADFDATLTERDDLAMLAIQGPNARKKVISLFSETQANKIRALNVFFGQQIDDYFIARTGYTGEDGFEVLLSHELITDFWDKLLQIGVKPIGLGARDTLRLEAGMNLYGTDMNESTSPLVSGLGWTIAWSPEERDFIGRKALETEKTIGTTSKLVGLVLQGRGVLRNHQKVMTNAGKGEITSGTFSPSLKKAIAMARVPIEATGTCQVAVRKKLLTATIIKPVFVRNGQSCL